MSSKHEAPPTRDGGETRLKIRVENAGTKSKQGRLILSEEHYQSTLSAVVQRDYYPSIPSLHRDLEVLKRRAVGDIAGAVAVRRSFRRAALEEERKIDAERDEDERARRRASSFPSSCTAVRKRPRPLDQESVTGFHDRATSEDNEDYLRVSRWEQGERTKRLQAVYGAELGKGGEALQLKACIDYSGEQTYHGAETPLLAASEQFDPPRTTLATAFEKSDSKDKNSLFFAPDHYPHKQIQTDAIEDQALVLQKGKVDTTTKNGCMPPAPPLPATKQGTQKEFVTSLVSKKEEEKNDFPNKLDLVEYLPKLDPNRDAEGRRSRPTINPANTRFSHQSESRLPPRAARSSVREQTPEGRIPDISDQESETDLDDTFVSLANERADRAEALKQARESHVAMTPIIVPGSCRDSQGRGDQNSSPIVTYGMISSTPLVLSGLAPPIAGPTAGPIDHGDYGDSAWVDDGDCFEPTRKFALPCEDGAEATARRVEVKLADRAMTFRSGSKKRKGKQSFRGRTKSTMSSAQSRVGTLTPAARALLERTTPTPSARQSLSVWQSSALASALRPSYTPMTEKKSSSVSKRKAFHVRAAAATPSCSADRKVTLDVSGGGKAADNITDGLLKM